MAIRSFPFNSVQRDRKYKAEDFAIHESNLYTNGILGESSDNLQVFANDDMSVYVNRGIALINGTTMLNDNDYNLKVDVADSVMNRIDKVILRLDKLKRTLVPEIKKGKYSSNPVPPVLQQDVDVWEIGIAEIKINKGAIKISQGDIRDLRHTKECGVATFRGMPIDLDSLYIQYEDELRGLVKDTRIDLIELLEQLDSFSIQCKDDLEGIVDNAKISVSELLEQLNNILTEDEFGQLIIMINEKQDKKLKDKKTTNGYELEVHEGKLYLKVVE